MPSRSSQRGKRSRAQHAAGRPGRLLSLDFDGVLMPTLVGNQVVATPHFGWVPVLARLLAPHPDVALLVHSTWRRTHDLAELRELLGVLGERVVGVVPQGPRYQSILEWLSQHLEFTDYRILDDEAHEFPVPPPAELILCDPSSGVSAATVQQSLQLWLGAPRRRRPTGR